MSVLTPNSSSTLVTMQTPNPGILGVFSGSAGLDGTTLNNSAIIGYQDSSSTDVSFYPLFAFAGIIARSGTITTAPTIEIGSSSAGTIAAGTVISTTLDAMTSLVMANPIPLVASGNITATVKVARTGSGTPCTVKVILIGIFA